MRSGGDLHRKGELVDSVAKKMNSVLETIARKYDRRRPDFGVNLFQSPANQQVMHEDLRSSLDCFHPTAKTHRILGTQLWNSMLKPSVPKPMDDWENIPACASATSKL